MSLPAVLAAARPIEGGFVAAIPNEWLQGRTSYGGLSTALALAAAQRLGDNLPPLRSATINFVGPLAGEVEVRARLLRQGRNATWASVEITAGGAIGLVATFVFMGPVESALHLHDVPPPAGLLAPEQGYRMPDDKGPSFAHHFDRVFALPRQTEPLPEINWWVRARERSGLDPMVELMLIADALPPGVMPLIRTGPVSSMTWIVNLLTPLPQSRDNWWLVRAAGNYAENGCSSQNMAIWNADGVAVATGMQSIAIFA
jgi:acyl-CoA thioesterase